MPSQMTTRPPTVPTQRSASGGSRPTRKTDSTTMGASVTNGARATRRPPASPLRSDAVTTRVSRGPGLMPALNPVLRPNPRNPHINVRVG